MMQADLKNPDSKIHFQRCIGFKETYIRNAFLFATSSTPPLFKIKKLRLNIQMSSVSRSFSQRPKRTFWSEDGPYIHTFSDFQTKFAAGNPEYVGNLILFENDTVLGNAINSLETTANSTDSHASLLDLSGAAELFDLLFLQKRMF